jgi:ribA/ribD-fused uncharacterized protein
MTNSNGNLSPVIIGDVDWMRNDYVSSVTIGGITYPTVEHAYQGSKFTDKSVQQSIANAQSVREARKIGRKSDGCLRSNWDIAKFPTMIVLLRQKFSNDPILADRLVKTGTAPIVMNGYDSYWGTGDDADGENKLGEALEIIRSELQLISGVDPADYDPKDTKKVEEDKVQSNLYNAIINDPSDELAKACQDLLVGSIALLTLVDANDFDAGFISRRTNVSLELAEAAVKKLRDWHSAVNLLNDLLKDGEDPFEDEDEDEDEDDEDDEDEDEDDWLNSPD